MHFLPDNRLDRLHLVLTQSEQIFQPDLSHKHIVCIDHRQHSQVTLEHFTNQHLRSLFLQSGHKGFIYHH